MECNNVIEKDEVVPLGMERIRGDYVSEIGHNIKDNY